MTDTRTTPSTGDTGALDPMFVDVQVGASTLIPTVHTLGWSTPASYVSWVEVTDSTGTWSTPRGAATRSHSHILLGLKAGAQIIIVPAYADVSGRVARGAPVVLDVPDAPAELPSFEIAQPVPDPALPGRFWTLLYYIGGIQSHAVIIDQDGDPVWWASSPDPTKNILMAKPSLDGLAVLTAHFRGGSQGIRRTPLGAMSVADQTFTPTLDAHHDFIELPGGRYAYMSHEFDMIEWGDFGRLSTQLDVVLEIDEGAAVATDAEKRFDPRDIDVLVAPVCSHSQPIESADGSIAQWGHANSLLWDDTDDTYIINFRNLNTVMKIERATGERVWSIGGLSNDFVASRPDLWFDHGHMSQWGPEGFTIFSNELHGGGSILYHYGIDATAQTIDLVWSYAQPDGYQVGVLGDVDRTPDGAYLASWATAGRLERITAAGEVSWRATAAPAVNVSRAVWVEDLYDLSAGDPLQP
jgi:hypothetical protein